MGDAGGLSLAQKGGLNGGGGGGAGGGGSVVGDDRESFMVGTGALPRAASVAAYSTASARWVVGARGCQV